MAWSLMDQYRDLLLSYLHGKKENHLYMGQKLSRWMMDEQITPEEIIHMHLEAMKSFEEELPQKVSDSFSFLIEVMVGYGMAYREHQSLRNNQQQLNMQIEWAAQMQRTLLPKEVPVIPGLDIGVISKPAQKMSGDFYQFLYHGSRHLGVAVADIVGKGVPAALSMSMIKYAIDGLKERQFQPRALLKRLNELVVKNVDPGMFITMIYGVYDMEQYIFHYASAGHEPGFYYCQKDDSFYDMKTKGLVLGVDPKTEYPEFALQLHPGDKILLMTDGVLDIKWNGDYLERSQLAAIFKEELDSSMQKMAENIYRRLIHLSDYKLRDDFTLIVMGRSV
ncbi:PP2C family protein-serine/threonine phosphatase [Microaerobacter geothermalis]|uniref:PP2C family protein-serine/threonine phosphatase n=1 Tax=Microaerobacter geothermalis TaxID=674972 RepID=UPI001F159A9A|nr:PP2C family protein-serine/threonine phosphatase [Microaerobacter geothermalis]MCF6093754.1 PP2C family protein-serine/threonine phosphatase [Microaerobacter geothermalis]